METSSHQTILSIIREQALSHAHAPALIGEDAELSYRGLVERCDHYTDWAVTQDMQAGAIVCLLMPNCPDYVAIWCGIAEAGHTVALINTNLVGDALIHSIRHAGAERIIVDVALLDRLVTVRGQLQAGLQIWVHGGDAADLPRIDAAIDMSDARVPARSRPLPPKRSDRALLISTSGTTGLPKWAKLTHARVLEWSSWFAGMMDVRPEDRLYDCLPLYHSIGGVVAIGSMLSRGGSVLIRRRFSAGRFWHDIGEGGCTIFQYIGELCRYLVGTPTHPAETAHRLRLCCGNGLRGEVWHEFQERFRIPRILEFYAATEGHVSLYNFEGKPGAIGRIPAYLAHHFRIELVRSDVETGEPEREAGRCIPCRTDEVGEAIAEVGTGDHASARRFDGYTDPEASRRKLLHDVFVQGDRWFRTGDLMRRDRENYYYFVDRIGDTYRWKGENVSTMEVAGVVGSCPGVTGVVVYGVALPGRDGRAGMAAITTDQRFDFPALHAHLHANLPEYAHPVFVRVCEEIRSTGTFRPIKGPLAQAGLSVSREAGELWLNDRRTGRFVACDEPLLHLVRQGGAL